MIIRRRLLASVVAVAAFAIVVSAVAGASPGSAPSPWSARTLELARTLPVQESGRVKPLDSFAAVGLLRLNHKRSCTDENDRRLEPTEFILDLLFRPEEARRYPCFLVADSDVLDAVGLAHDRKGRSGRYSFDALAPARARLSALARDYSKIEARDRARVESGVIDLAHAVAWFDSVSHAMDFARSEVDVPKVERLRALWPGHERVRVLDVLERLSEVGGDPHAGVDGAPGAGGATDEDARAANALREAAFDALESAQALSMIPAPEGSASAEWLNPGMVLYAASMGRSAGEPALEAVRRLVAMAEESSKPAEFEREMSAFHDVVVGAAKARGEYSGVPLEVALARLDPFYRAIYLYVFAFLLLAISWAWSNRWLVRGAWALILAGALLHLTGVVVRSVLRGHPPINSLYDTTTFISLGAVIVFLVVERMQRRGLALAIAPVVGALILFIGQQFDTMRAEDSLEPLVAVLDTNFWLALHVTCINFGYLGGLIAAAVAHVHILGRTFGWKKHDSELYGLMHRTTYGLLCFGLFFSVVGTILGGIWANESWGRFWGWDPKENGALMICISQLAILHARLGGMLKAFGFAVATVLSGCVIAFSWWHVNLLGIGLHQYGWSGGVMRALVTFYGVEVVVMATALATWLGKRAYGEPAAIEARS